MKEYKLTECGFCGLVWLPADPSTTVAIVYCPVCGHKCTFGNKGE